MSNISDLKAALIVAAAELTDTVTRLECLALIDDWYACRIAVAAVQSNSVQSYSIAGRSITKHNLSDFVQMERDMYARISEHLYGRGSALITLEHNEE